MENINLEFKELNREDGRIPDSAIRAVTAFLNTEGGTIYIGIRDDGSIAGITNPDDVSMRLTNMLLSSVLPNPIPFVRVETIQMEGRLVIRAEVSVGTERPYYLSKTGLRPGGVFMRSGPSCVPVNEEGIRNLITETSGKSFEAARSLDQDLTFAEMQKAMEERNLEFGPLQMRNLKLLGDDGLFTNLALLLSDRCRHTIKMARFQGNGEAAVFRTRKECSGSLFRQLEDAYSTIMDLNRIKASFDGLMRHDRYDWPPLAIRECLLNAIVHRNYLMNGSTLINIFDDRMEFISFGGLVGNLSLKEIEMGASMSRNPHLADIFYRMNLVESFGTGIRKIISLYADEPIRPEFIATENLFKVVLPSLNESPLHKEIEYRTDSRSAKVEEAIIAYAERNGSITRKETEELTGFKTTRAFILLKRLCDEGKLKQNSEGRLTRYTPN